MIAGENKQKIRTRYKGVDPSELEVIPAIATDEIALEQRKLKVAAYVRVSTENDEQTSSYELQVNDFTDRINANPNWEFVGIYSDEGISGTELSHRKGMLQMIEDARAGKIDHILAKSIARFARNVVDCLSIIDELKKLGVGVHFDENNLYTLDATGSLVLTILATVAEEESRSKSFIMNWSIERRFSKGIFLTPELLGYDQDEEGNKRGVVLYIREIIDRQRRHHQQAGDAEGLGEDQAEQRGIFKYQPHDFPERMPPASGRGSRFVIRVPAGRKPVDVQVPQDRRQPVNGGRQRKARDPAGPFAEVRDEPHAGERKQQPGRGHALRPAAGKNRSLFRQRAQPAHHRTVGGRNDIPQEVARHEAEYDDGGRRPIGADFGELQHRQGKEHQRPDQEPRTVFPAEPESDLLKDDASRQGADDVSQAGDHEDVADDAQGKCGMIGKKSRKEVQFHAGQHDEEQIGDSVGV